MITSDIIQLTNQTGQKLTKSVLRSYYIPKREDLSNEELQELEKQRVVETIYAAAEEAPPTWNLTAAIGRWHHENQLGPGAVL